MLCKKIRLGRDAELRTTQSGKSVLGFAGAYDVGYGDNKHTQWIDCSLWGDRAQQVASMLVKGVQIVIYADDVQIEEYPKKDGTQGAKLKCRIVNFEFCGANPNAAPQQQAPIQQQAPAPQAAPANSFNNFEDDIPF